MFEFFIGLAIGFAIGLFWCPCKDTDNPKATRFDVKIDKPVKK